MDAEEAASFLGVKRASLYAYVSRGWIQRVPASGGRGRLYLRGDLQRVRARHDARAGHGAVAASALNWGEPVMETEVSAIDVRGPLYRGHAATALAARGVSFETVAELLWTGELPYAPQWESRGPGVSTRALAALLPVDATPFDALPLAVPALEARDGLRLSAHTDGEHDRARTLIRRLAAFLAASSEPPRVSRALDESSIAGVALCALGAAPSHDRQRAINQALILCADHELNASTFAARVAASTGATLYAAISAALAALSGPKHGGECSRVEALVAEAATPQKAAAALQFRARRGERIAGFGHRLYPAGDPRTPPLLELAHAIAPRNATVRTIAALVTAGTDAGYGSPTLDMGLVALAAATGLPAGSALALVAIGRSAGWVAHALEQRASGIMLRPRARYTGVLPLH